MNVFVDLGAFNGDTIEQFRNWSKVSFPDKEEWYIHSFEPNPKFTAQLRKKENKYIKTYNKAAWVENKHKSFAVDDSESPLGSTLMPGKQAIWDVMDHIYVECFDFSEWLKQFQDDFVVVKMDIEGAEFPVLEKMIEDDTDKICDHLLVEFHPNKVVEYTTTYKEELIKKLKSRGVNIKEWH